MSVGIKIDPDSWYTPTQIAKSFDISEHTLRGLGRDGLLKASYVGNRKLYCGADILKLLKRQQGKGRTLAQKGAKSNA